MRKANPKVNIHKSSKQLADQKRQRNDRHKRNLSETATDSEDEEVRKPTHGRVFVAKE